MADTSRGQRRRVAGCSRHFKPVATMQEWGLQSEPWLFLVDKEGKIASRYEGGITMQELEPAVVQLLQ